MTIDEAIKHCEEVAELNEECTRIYDEHGRTMESFSCKECATKHRQLAEWLKELKAYQKAYEEIRKLPLAWEFGEGVIRCLTIIEDCLEEVNADESSETM